jgi:hypothetical protein
MPQTKIEAIYCDIMETFRPLFGENNGAKGRGWGCYYEYQNDYCQD